MSTCSNTPLDLHPQPVLFSNDRRRMVCRTKGCKFPGCYKDNRPSSKYCEGHYKQRQRGTKLKPLGWRETQTCLVCHRKHEALGLCKNHYIQYRIGQESDNGDECAFQGCKFKHFAKNLCYFHYQLNYGVTYRVKKSEELAKLIEGRRK